MKTVNPFLQAVSSHDSMTENGALAHSTTGDLLLDYFQRCGTYRERDIEKVASDISAIYGENPVLATMIVFYNRMVTRKVKGFAQSETVQKGQGNRDEFRKSLRYLALHHSNGFYKNLWLVPVVGVWKDLWHIDTINVFDRQHVLNLIKRGMECDYNKELLAKYLPRIRSNSNIKATTHKNIAYHHALNRLARDVTQMMGWSEKQYRKFKSSGKAHVFQQQITNQDYQNIDFNAIPGKALFQMTKQPSKNKQSFIDRHGLTDRYVQWIESKPVVKFTGYPHDLYRAINFSTIDMNHVQRITANKQFDGLLEKTRADGTSGLNENVWVAIDTSGSMGWNTIDNKGTRPIDVCVSLGIYFSSLNEGAFKDHVVMFDDNSYVKKLSGSFVDKCLQLQKTCAMGGTNFQSVIDEIVRVRRNNPQIPVEDYPTTLLVVSDMQFNSVSPIRSTDTITNQQAAQKKLTQVGLPPMRFIWWNLNVRSNTSQQAKLDDENVTLLSGFDPAIISIILGGKQEIYDETTKTMRKLNAYENMLKALDQEVLRNISI